MIIGKIYASSKFSYNKQNQLFIGEISELPEALRELWNDSMDLGFGIRSQRTGAIVLYALDGIERDPDGDVVSWHFSPTAYSITQYPSCADTSVVILND